MSFATSGEWCALWCMETRENNDTGLEQRESGTMQTHIVWIQTGPANVEPPGTQDKLSEMSEVPTDRVRETGASSFLAPNNSAITSLGS